LQPGKFPSHQLLTSPPPIQSINPPRSGQSLVSSPPTQPETVLIRSTVIPPAKPPSRGQSHPSPSPVSALPVYQATVVQPQTLLKLVQRKWENMATMKGTEQQVLIFATNLARSFGNPTEPRTEELRNALIQLISDGFKYVLDEPTQRSPFFKWGLKPFVNQVFNQSLFFFCSLILISISWIQKLQRSSC
jgi:hypothetical protein